MNRIKGIYAIIDAIYLSAQEMEGAALKVIEGGAGAVQLRAKGLGGAETLLAAKALRKATLGTNVPFIVNDRVDIALMSEADGVHLGQDDIPLKEARRLLGQRIIGISTHDLDEALKAEHGGADYISFGPIFPTPTKKDADTPKGVTLLKDLKNTVKSPIIAIGGICEENIEDVTKAGADAAAVISDILTSPDIKVKTQRLCALFRK